MQIWPGSPRFGVMLTKPGEKGFNVLLAERVDLVLPLERDLDEDPLHDDEAILRDAEGNVVRRLCNGDADVTEDPDSGLLLYRFRQVPFGIYSVWVVIGAQEKQVLAGIVVRRKGVFIGDLKLTTDVDSTPLDRIHGVVAWDGGSDAHAHHTCDHDGDVDVE